MAVGSLILIPALMALYKYAGGHPRPVGHTGPKGRVFVVIFFFFNTFIYFIYLFLAALGLHCCVRAFSSCSEWGLLLAAVCRLLIAVASLVADHGL